MSEIWYKLLNFIAIYKNMWCPKFGKPVWISDSMYFFKKCTWELKTACLKSEVPRAIPLTYFYHRKKFVIIFFREWNYNWTWKSVRNLVKYGTGASSINSRLRLTNIDSVGTLRIDQYKIGYHLGTFLTESPNVSWAMWRGNKTARKLPAQRKEYFVNFLVVSWFYKN